MATRYRFSNSQTPHFITYATVAWADALSRPAYKQIIIDSLQHCIVAKGLILHAWVIMSNHVHLIASAIEGAKLEEIMRDHKKFTARQLLQAIDQNPQESRKDWLMWLFKSAGNANSNNKLYQFWQQDNHPIELITHAMLLQKLEYIHQNAVQAGLVWLPEQYVYSSAVDYSMSIAGRLPLVKIT
jgi:REP element-mobilizing transposase RayT